MIKRGVNLVYAIITYIFYAFCPNIVLFTTILTKDVLFGVTIAALTLLLIELIELDKEKEKQTWNKKMILFIMTGILSCLLRNNMVYAIVVSSLITLLLFKDKRKTIGLSLGVIAIGFFLIKGVLYSHILGVGSGNVKEALSVPLNQIANVYTQKEEVLTEDEKELILEYIANADDYDRFFADPVKDSFNTGEFLNNKKEFMELWGTVFLKEPLAYIDAFLALNLPYWYPEADGVRVYIEVGNYSSDYVFENKDYLPQINGFYRRVAANTNIDNISRIMRLPIIRQFFSLSFPFWLLISMLITLVMKKRKEFVLPFLPAACLWLTYLLGPVSNFRYIYPLFILYPIIVWVMIGNIGRNDNEYCEER